MSVIHFSRKPYNVTYHDFHTGNLITVTRRPPEKMHPVLPEDIVELTTSKNQDWQAGDEFAVKNITARQPNVLQLANKDGDTTFVDYYDVKLKEEVAVRNEHQARLKNNKYLIWP